MIDWLDGLDDALGRQQAAVLITVIAVRGSTPRDAGTCMTVTAQGYFGTIGGGNLEYQAIAAARDMLTQNSAANPLQRDFLLGPSLGQCCGGAATLRFERVSTAVRREALAAERAPSDFLIALFGAGHVGKALVHVLHALPCQISWFDGRAEQFPAVTAANVNVEVSDELDFEVDDLPAGSYLLITTHSHALDQAICARALRRKDAFFRYIGLIGSNTKCAQVRQRLLREGLSAAELDRLTCPIGIDGISGKHPAEIAVAVAAQLLQLRDAQRLPMAGA